MRDYTAYTHEQLVHEILAKQATNKKLRTNLSEFGVTFQTAREQIRDKAAECSSLTQQLNSRTQEWQQLQSELKSVANLHQQAVESATTHERKICRLDQDLKLEQKRSASLEKGKKQAEAAKVELEMMYQQQASDIVALRKELTALQSVFKTIQHQQQTDHHAIGHLSTGKPQQSPPVEANGAPVCEDCSAAQRIAAQFKQRLEVLEAAQAARDSKQAQSMPSTQDHSGDTNDDRGLRSDVDNIFVRLRACEQSHRGVAEQMSSWRTLFSAAGNPMACQQQDASEEMQISPVGGEGSNVMPGQPVRAEAAEVRRIGMQSTLLTHVGRDGTPHAGSTAGDGEDIARHDTLGAGSDCLSDVIGTSASLMQAAVPRPYAAVRLRPPHAVDGTNRAINYLHNKIVEEQAAADSPKATSPKRKAIALEPGPVQLNPGRKRRRQAGKAGAGAGGDQAQQPAQPQVHPTQPGPGVDPSVKPPQQRQGGTAKHGCSKAFLTRFGIEQPDATVVDFLELQLGRITHAHQHPEEEDMAEVVPLVVHDIHSGWALQECPLECITAQFVTSITNCAAAPPSHDSGLSRQQLTDLSERGSSPAGEEASEAACFEDMPLARLWCSPAARKHHILTWLLHCASQLDALLSTPTQPTSSSQAPAEPAAEGDALGPSDQAAPAAASQNPSEGPAKKRRGRPPGSKNKKTLQKLEAQGVAPNSPDSHPGPSQRQQQQQHEASGSRATKAKLRSGPKCLQQLDFLTGLHKKVLQALGEACDPKRSGPFEAEVCCLSAAAALLCRVMGKVQPVSAQIVEVLRSTELPARSKLQCAAAALEQHPDALMTSLPGTNQDSSSPTLSLVDLCCHAALQSLVEQAPQESRPADATVAAAAASSAEAGELVTGVSGRTALAIQSWSRNKLTQTAGSQLHAQYHRQWEQLEQDCNETDGALAGGGESEGASKAWAVAEAAMLAQLCSMGVADGTCDDASQQLLWQVMQVALDIAITHLGWEWAYYKVVDQGMSHALAGLLQSLVEASSRAPVAMTHLLACLKHVTHCMARVFTESPGAWAEALQNLAGRLKLLAQNPALRQHLQQTGVQELLICTADELLEIKAEHTPIFVPNAQQNCGETKCARYHHMDAEVEEI